MEFKSHSSFSEIDETEWNTLLQKSQTNVPFLRYGYLKRWWDFKGGGEWQDAQLNIISAQKEGELVGIAPFFKATQSGSTKLLFLGSIEISDYLDFILAPQYSEGFFDQLFNYISKNDFLGTNAISLYNIPESSYTLGALAKISRNHGWQLTIEKAYHTPTIHLPDDWETYLAGVDKKQRHEIRRKLRRAQEFPDMIKWQQVSDPESLDQAVEDFFSLMVLDPEKSGFLSEDMRKQMRSLITWALEEKILWLSFLTIDGEKAAAYLCFDYGNRIWVYNSGYDQQFSEYSPGWVLLSYLIRHAIENGRQDFDFMRGEELYKYRFGAVDGFVMKANLLKPGN